MELTERQLAIMALVEKVGLENRVVVTQKGNPRRHTLYDNLVTVFRALRDAEHASEKLAIFEG